jgi:hypothetical protein
MHKKLLISLRIRPSFFDEKMLCPKEIKIILFLCHLKYILSVSVMVYNVSVLYHTVKLYRAAVVVIVWYLDFQLPIQSVPITTNVVRSNPVHGEVYSIQLYVIKFVSDLRQVSGFLRVRLNAQR